MRCVCVCGRDRCDLADSKSGLGHPECNYSGAEAPENVSSLTSGSL